MAQDRNGQSIAEMSITNKFLPDPKTEVGSIVAELFQASGLEVPRAAVVGNALEMYWALLATGRFLAVLPQSVLRFSIQRPTIKILPVKLAAQPRPVGIVTLRNRTLSPPAQLFIDCVREVARPLAKS